MCLFGARNRSERGKGRSNIHKCKGRANGGVCKGWVLRFMGSSQISMIFPPKKWRKKREKVKFQHLSMTCCGIVGECSMRSKKEHNYDVWIYADIRNGVRVWESKERGNWIAGEQRVKQLTAAKKKRGRGIACILWQNCATAMVGSSLSFISHKVARIFDFLQLQKWFSGLHSSRLTVFVEPKMKEKQNATYYYPSY